MLLVVRSGSMAKTAILPSHIRPNGQPSIHHMRAECSRSAPFAINVAEAAACYGFPRPFGPRMSGRTYYSQSELIAAVLILA